MRIFAKEWDNTPLPCENFLKKYFLSSVELEVSTVQFLCTNNKNSWRTNFLKIIHFEKNSSRSSTLRARPWKTTTYTQCQFKIAVIRDWSCGGGVEYSHRQLFGIKVGFFKSCFQKGGEKFVLDEKWRKLIKISKIAFYASHRQLWRNLGFVWLLHLQIW